MDEIFQIMQRQVEEHVLPGQTAELLLGLPDDLNLAQLSTIQDALKRRGMRLTAPVEIGTGPWPNTLRLVFQREANDPAKIGFLPLAVIVMMALGGAGIVALLGFRVTQVVGSIATNLVPLALIAAGVFLGYQIIKSQSPART